MLISVENVYKWHHFTMVKIPRIYSYKVESQIVIYKILVIIYIMVIISCIFCGPGFNIFFLAAVLHYRFI